MPGPVTQTWGAARINGTFDLMLSFNAVQHNEVRPWRALSSLFCGRALRLREFIVVALRASRVGNCKSSQRIVEGATLAHIAREYRRVG